MSNTPFGHDYARLYDLTYAAKDYNAEADLVVAAFERFGQSRTKSVLDLGCGTGNHALALAQRGYSVTGVDRSPEMLRQAREKSAARHVKVDWIESDIRSLDLPERFDAALLMFAVLGYITGSHDLLDALSAVRRHLREGALLLFDCWYGPAVLQQRPEVRTSEITTPEGPVRRHVTSLIDERHQTCEVQYRLDGGKTAPSVERHLMRYFFPMELDVLLFASSFRLASLTAFPTLDKPVDASTWNAFCVAIAT